MYMWRHVGKGTGGKRDGEDQERMGRIYRMRRGRMRQKEEGEGKGRWNEEGR